MLDACRIQTQAGPLAIRRWRAIVFRPAQYIGHSRSRFEIGPSAWERAAHPVRLDGASFTRDFAVFVRYHFDFLRKIPARHPSPPALTLKELD